MGLYNGQPIPLDAEHIRKLQAEDDAAELVAKSGVVENEIKTENPDIHQETEAALNTEYLNDVPVLGE